MPRKKQDADPPTLGRGGEIVLFQEGGVGRLEVRLQGETLWLSLQQLADLYQRDKSVISRHLRSILATGELEREVVVAKNATTAADGKTYQVDFYNLDMIISVGYRVHSLRGTQFRIWATRTLKDTLVRGYTLNESRLQAQVERLEGLLAAVQLVGRVATERSLSSGEAKGLLKVVGDFSLALDLLDQYDHGRLSLRSTTASAGRVLEETRRRRPAPRCALVLGRVDAKRTPDRAAPVLAGRGLWAARPNRPPRRPAGHGFGGWICPVRIQPGGAEDLEAVAKWIDGGKP
ncbi:MAG: RhuM family protein [Candidatus Delongbacteria bacterium]